MRLAGLHGEVLDTLERDRVMQLADEIETELTQLAFKYAPTQNVADLLELRLRSITDPSLRAWVRFVVLFTTCQM